MKTRMQSVSSIKRSQQELREFIMSSPGNILEEDDSIWEDPKIAYEIKLAEDSLKYIPQIDLS
jgi:hypothetical protein